MLHFIKFNYKINYYGPMLRQWMFSLLDIHIFSVVYMEDIEGWLMSLTQLYSHVSSSSWNQANREQRQQGGAPSYLPQPPPFRHRYVYMEHTLLYKINRAHHLLRIAASVPGVTCTFIQYICYTVKSIATGHVEKVSSNIMNNDTVCMHVCALYTLYCNDCRDFIVYNIIIKY